MVSPGEVAQRRPDETLTVTNPQFAARKKGLVEKYAESPVVELGAKGTRPRAAAGRNAKP
jgi:hypothetical protein